MFVSISQVVCMRKRENERLSRRHLFDTGCKFLLFVNADHKSSSQNSNQNEIFFFTSLCTHQPTAFDY